MWFSRIQRAQELQRKVADQRKAAIQLYTGTFFGGPFDVSRDMEEVNFLFEFIKVSVASYYSRHPKIFVRTAVSAYQPFVETLERVMDYYVRELDLKGKAKAGLLDGILQPPGWGKIGYTRLRRGISGDNGKLESELGILDETRRDERVYFSHVPSWRVLWPDGYNDPRQCPYLIEQEPVTLEDLLLNPIYKPKVKKLIQESGSSRRSGEPKLLKFKSQPDLFPSTGGQDKELIPKKLFHVWDRRNRERFTLLEGFHEETLFDMNWNWVNEGFPLYDLTFNPVPESENNANSYPLSDVQAMMPQLRQLSELTSAQMRHGRRSGAVIFARKGDHSPDEVAQMQRMNDLEFVELENVSESSLRPFVMPSMPGDWYKLRGQTLEDLMRISGFQQLLQMQKGIDTATESENLLAGERLRVGERQDIVETFIKDVARGLAALIWQFTSREKIAQIIGEEVSEEMWPTFPADENGNPTMEAYRIVQEEIRYDIEAGSMRPPKDEAVERKQWENLAQTLKTLFPNRFKEAPFIQQWLKKYDYKDIDMTLIADDEQERAVAEEESRLMAQGIPQVVGPNENHDIHIEVHSGLLKGTPEEDEHIAQHGAFREQKQPLGQPQQGDTKVPAQGGRPELKREGVTGFADLVGSVAPDQRGSGVNTSRR